MPMISFHHSESHSARPGRRHDEFAGIFLRGNPFVAMSSLVKFNLARDEQVHRSAYREDGAVRSRLTVEELLSAMHDPRFSVRYEAVIAISRTRSDPRLTEALIKL
jgi:HEAT repeat protein